MRAGPVLAGPHWEQVLAGGVLAAILRNVIFTGLQTASSVGHEVSTRHALRGDELRGAERVRFQIETSKNFELRGVARILCGGLDRHIEHHLYPHLPPGRSPRSLPRCGRSARKHGIRYQEFPTFSASLRDSASYLHGLSARIHASGSP